MTLLSNWLISLSSSVICSLYKPVIVQHVSGWCSYNNRFTVEPLHCGYCGHHWDRLKQVYMIDIYIIYITDKLYKHASSSFAQLKWLELSLSCTHYTQQTMVVLHACKPCLKNQGYMCIYKGLLYTSSTFNMLVPFFTEITRQDLQKFVARMVPGHSNEKYCVTNKPREWPDEIPFQIPTISWLLWTWLTTEREKIWQAH